MNTLDNISESIMFISGCTQEQAKKVIALYIKLKIARIDPVNGSFMVNHGAFLDKETLMNAINFTK